MSSRGEPILIVGTNTKTREALDAILRPEGYSLLSAEGEREARRATVAHLPHLIILALSASVRKGHALVRKLKSDPATTRIPVLVIHAVAERYARLDAFDAGATDVITELNPVELRLRIRNLLHVASRSSLPPVVLLGLQSADGDIEVAIIDALPASVAVIDHRGTVVSVNRAWRRFANLNGMPASNQFGIGTNYLVARKKNIADANGRKMNVGIRSVLAGRALKFSMEYPCHTPDQQRWFMMTAARLGSNPHGAIIMHTDITQRHFTKLSLAEKNIHFNQMAANNRDIFFLANAKSLRVLYVSPAYDDIVGKPGVKLLTHPAAWLEVVPQPDRVRMAAEYAAHVPQPGVPFQCVFQIRRADHALRWLSMKVFWIEEEGGLIRHIAGVAQDITESKNAALNLRESERRFVELLNNTSMLVIMLDLDAKITFCNSALLKLMNFRLEDVVGGNWFDVFSIPGPIQTRKHFMELLARSERESRYENELVSMDGVRHLICWNTSVLRNIDGVVIGTTSIGEDITEQKESALKILRLNANLEKMSSQLLHAQEQERISLARELHDELGQHLALLKIDLHHLRSFIQDKVVVTQWEKIDASVATLIAQIRVISVSLRPPALDYLGLESALRQLLERQFSNGPYHFVFEYAGLPAKLAPPIEIAIYRIIQESTNNIVRHAYATIVVVELNGDESGKELELLIRDNGIGFERRAESFTELGDVSGTGIRGMEERVRLLGGKFNVVFPAAGGACVCVSLSLDPI